MAYTLAEWREARAQGVEHVLPSGLRMRLREVGILDLVEQGKIPKPLLGKVQEMVSSGKVSVSLDELKEYLGLLDVTIKATAVQPEVRDEPGEDWLGVDEIPNMDKVAVFNWANQGVKPLEPFREEPR